MSITNKENCIIESVGERGYCSQGFRGRSELKSDFFRELFLGYIRALRQ